jgi:hypothetical protein
LVIIPSFARVLMLCYNAAMEAEPIKAALPKRKRRWFQFSLRTLLIVTTVVAVQCAVCLPIFRDWQKYNSTAERVRRVSELLRRDFPMRPLDWLPDSRRG